MFSQVGELGFETTLRAIRPGGSLRSDSFWPPSGCPSSSRWAPGVEGSFGNCGDARHCGDSRGIPRDVSGGALQQCCVAKSKAVSSSFDGLFCMRVCEDTRHSLELIVCEGTADSREEQYLSRSFPAVLRRVEGGAEALARESSPIWNEPWAPWYDEEHDQLSAIGFSSRDEPATSSDKDVVDVVAKAGAGDDSNENVEADLGVEREAADNEESADLLKLCSEPVAAALPRPMALTAAQLPRASDAPSSRCDSALAESFVPDQPPTSNRASLPGQLCPTGRPAQKIVPILVPTAATVVKPSRAKKLRFILPEEQPSRLEAEKEENFMWSLLPQPSPASRRISRTRRSSS
eukprot:CAMPEP_0117586474 /NCGR_PEP_ID=MMETSP0784-20121206/68743_1 /TAXON_ID=39447 /ORGANISM="" /LENGTH=348 /DNA_ID=CAMNT_0005387581 /DNA_START=28 /DNA_END=1070 /DNA_ORIENTATION=-